MIPIDLRLWQESRIILFCLHPNLPFISVVDGFVVTNKYQFFVILNFDPGLFEGVVCVIGEVDPLFSRILLCASRRLPSRDR